MSHVLIKFDKNFADEFDVEALKVFEGTMDEAKEYLDKKLNSECPWSFGTNEGWDTVNTKEYYSDPVSMDDITLTPITADEAAIIIKYIGKSFGTMRL